MAVQETAIELWFLLMAFLLLSRIDFHLKCNGINDRFYALLNANVLCGWNAKVPLALFIKTNLKMETRLSEPENVRIIWEESLFLNHTNLSLSLSESLCDQIENPCQNGHRELLSWWNIFTLHCCISIIFHYECSPFQTIIQILFHNFSILNYNFYAKNKE